MMGEIHMPEKSMVAGINKNRTLPPLSKVFQILIKSHPDYAKMSEINQTLSCLFLTKGETRRYLRILENLGYVKIHRGMLFVLKGEIECKL